MSAAVHWLLRSLSARLALLGAVFIVVPILVYGELRRADDQRQEILLAAVREKGIVLGRALEPVLARADDTPFVKLASELERYASEDVRLRVLFSPRAGSEPEGFFYVAAAPSVPLEVLEREHGELAAIGILDRLDASCAGDTALALPIRLQDGELGVLTSIAPVTTARGCWVLMVSHPASTLAGAASGRPYWQSREMIFAGLTYSVMALLVIGVFLGLWRSLYRFSRLARRVRDSSDGVSSFAARNTVPELRVVAESFDSMVATLRAAAAELRRAAEDNAHAFKTPIGIVRQAIEPFRRLAPDDVRARRSIEAIEAALVRLEGLVTSSRRLDQAAADRLEPERATVDLSALLRHLAATYGEVGNERGVRIIPRIDGDVRVDGSAGLIETAIENVLDNALGFSPAGGVIDVTLARNGPMAEIAIADEGPGVAPERLERIFERYVSERAGMVVSDGLGDGESGHSGIGLWIARRNLEAMGGRVWAAGRPQGGLCVHLHLPAKI